MTSARFTFVFIFISYLFHILDPGPKPGPGPGWPGLAGPELAEAGLGWLGW
mgnify:CR=1 FL=1